MCFSSDPRSQVALVGFDSEPHLIQDYTHSGDQVNAELQATCSRATAARPFWTR